MENPINNTVFDTRDLIAYREHLQEELLDLWKSYFEGTDMEQEVEDHTFEDIDFNLEGFRDGSDFNEMYEHYNNIDTFCAELSDTPDYQWGEGVIHETYFTDYCEELLKDVGYIPRDMPSWIEIDFEKTAENMKVDYTEIIYDSESYYVRA